MQRYKLHALFLSRRHQQRAESYLNTISSSTEDGQSYFRKWQRAKLGMYGISSHTCHCKVDIITQFSILQLAYFGHLLLMQAFITKIHCLIFRVIMPWWVDIAGRFVSSCGRHLQEQGRSRPLSHGAE